MKNGIKRILTLLLAFSMLFGLMATTVAYATSETAGKSSLSQSAGQSSGTVGDSAINGWCDIVYDANGVVITLTPDKEAILGISKAQLSEILNVLVEAVKTLVVDEIKGQILGGTGPSFDETVDSEGITVDNVWTNALNAYINSRPDKYPEGAEDSYIDFLKNAIADETNAEIGDFIDYACSLLESALATGAISVDQLPEVESIEDKILGVFEDKVNEFIEEAVTDYTNEYIAWLENGTPCTFNDDIKEIIDGQVKSYVESAVQRYIDAGYEPASDSVIDASLGDYLNGEIRSKIDSYVKAYVNGTLSDDLTDVKNLIDNTISDWVDELVLAWPNRVEGNPISDVAHEDIVAEIEITIDSYIKQYAEGVLADENADVEDLINGKIDDWADELLAAWPNPADNPLSDFAHSQINAEIKAKVDEYIRAYANNTLAEVTYKDLINGKIDDWADELLAAWPNAVAGNPISDFASDEINAEIRANVVEFINDYFSGALTDGELYDVISEKITEIFPLQVTLQQQKIAWDSLTEPERDEKIDSITDEAKGTQKAKDIIRDYWNDDTNRREVISEVVANEGVYADVLDDIIADANSNSNTLDIIEDYLKDVQNRRDAIADVVTKPAYKDMLDEIIGDANTGDIINDYLNDEQNRKDAIDEIITDPSYQEILDDLIKEVKTNSSYSDFIADEIDKYVSDFDAVVDTFRNFLEEIRAEDAAKYDSIIEQIKDEVKTKAQSAEVRDEAFNAVLGLDEAGVKSRIGKFVELLIVDYKVLYTEAQKNPPELDITSLLTYLNVISVNGHKLYDNGTVSLAALKALVAEIPTFEDIKDMDNEDMRLGWDVEIVTNFGVCDFSVDVVLGGGYEYVRRLASVIASHLEFYLDDDGVVRIHVIVPDNFASILVRACNSAKVPDTLKKKVFAVLSASPDDAYALFNALTFDEIMELLEHIDFEGLLDKDYIGYFEKIDTLTREQIIARLSKYERFDKLITFTNEELLARLRKYENYDEITGADIVENLDELSREEILTRLSKYERLDKLVTYVDEVLLEKLSKYENLEDVTNEEILNKIAEYERYYNKLVEYIRTAYEDYFPDKIKDNSLMDLYNGNGNFDIGGSYTVDVEKVLNKISEKYGALIASFIDVSVIKVAANLSVTFENINRVEYCVGDKVVREGFLPAGADLKFFGVTFVGGYIVTGWVDEDGVEYKTMPDADIRLYPVLELPKAVIESGVEKVYDGEAATLEVSALYDYFKNPKFTYQWFKDGVAIEGADGKTLDVVNVIDSGVYYAIVTVVDGEINESFTSNAVEVKITPKDADLSEIKWDYTEAYKYNGNAQYVYIDLETLPSYINIVENSYANNEKTLVGEYTATVQVVVVDSNYKLADGEGTLSLDWEIVKGILDLGVLEWDYTDPLVYNGSEQKIEIKNVGDVVFTYEGNAATNVGNYVAKVIAVECNDEGYEGIVGGVESIPTQSWSIVAAEFDLTNISFDDKTVTYNGQIHSIELNGADLLPVGTTVEFSEGKIDVGSYEMTATITNPNYVTKVLTATLTIEKAEFDLTNVKFEDKTVTYNGQKHTITLVGAEKLPEGTTYTYGGNDGVYEYINAGTYDLTATIENPNYETVVLNAVLTINKLDIDLSLYAWDYTGPYTYNGQSFTVILKDLGDLEVVYENNVKTNAGTYTATATLADKYNTANYNIIVGTVTKEWKINKATLPLDQIKWNYENEFVYNGTEFEVYLVDASGNKVDAFTYTGNKATNAGTYTATAVLTDELAANYVISGTFTDEIEWTIVKAQFDLSGVTFEDATITYDGAPHSIKITGENTLPEGTTVTYTPNSVIEVGVYNIVATIENANYHTKTLEATLTVKEGQVGPPVVQIQNNFYYKDANGNVIVSITGKNGLPVDHVLNFKDVTVSYQNTQFPANMFGEGMMGTVVGAYDIHFRVDGTENPVTDEFRVKLLIPASLRDANRTLAIVYIAENGEFENMNAKREGDYLVFDTTHFSVYSLVDITPVVVDDDGSFPWWILIIIGAVLIAGAVVLIIILKKRKTAATAEEVSEVITTDDGELAVVEEAEELVVEEAPAEETPAEEAPAEEAPAEEAPAEEAPAEEAPVEEAPVEEAPAEEAPAEEAPAEEAPAEEAPAAEEPVIVPDVIVSSDVEIPVRYRHSFMSRLIQSEPPIQDYYTVVKNALLAYKGVKARTSWNFESFNKGREQCAKLNVKGKNFLVYLNLDPNEYNVNKYHFQDVTGKPKVGDVPMLLKVKSDRGLKYAVELIDEMMNKFGFVRVEDAPYVDYHMPYETTEALAERDLVKVILPAGVMLDENSNVVKLDVGELLEAEKKADGKIVASVTEESEITANATEEAQEVADVIVVETVEEAPAEEAPVEETATAQDATAEETVEKAPIDVAHAEELLTDEEAIDSVKIIVKDARDTAKGNKMGEINLDTICENFEDGDEVTLKALKQKKLVGSSIGRIKILARGTMTKKLTVVADKFSLSAVKMITLAGGLAEQYK